MQRAKACKQPLLFAVMATPTPGEEVKRARQARGMSMAALAAGAGVDPTTVRRIERGMSKEPTKLGLLQAYLGIGPYAQERGPLEEIDLTAVKVPDLAAHMLEVATELSRRLSAGLAPDFSVLADESGRPDLTGYIPHTGVPPYIGPDEGENRTRENG